jgi:hypothetical protein
MLSLSGAAQRWNSSTSTRLGPVLKDELGLIDGGRHRYGSGHYGDMSGGAPMGPAVESSV